MILAADLRCFDPAFRGWSIRSGRLVSPEGWEATAGDILTIPLMRAQISAYQAKERQVLAMDEQLLPGTVPAIVASGESRLRRGRLPTRTVVTIRSHPISLVPHCTILHRATLQRMFCGATMHVISLLVHLLASYSHMEHFPIVLALARAGLQSPNVAVRQHVERLHAALKVNGATAETRALEKLLSSDERTGRIEPSRVILSRASIAGEVMTPAVRPPADRETGNFLAQILHSQQLTDRPLVFNESLQPAVDSLVEEWRHLEQFRALSVRPPLNCLLFGAPGTGKTRLAYSIAKKLELPLVIARLDGLISSFLGTTARNIAALFDFANRYQCILLLDEFDAVAKIRDDPHEVGEIKRVVNTLLQCLDSRSDIGFTIAITNHEQLLDTAIWRRFDVRIQVPKPDFGTRQTIVKHYTAASPLKEPDHRLLAWFTKGRSGAEIETLCNAILRMFVLKKSDEFSIAEALRTNAQLSADFRESPRQQKVVGDFEDLAKALAVDEELAFTQAELAQIFNRDQSTVSRWLKQDRATRGR